MVFGGSVTGGGADYQTYTRTDTSLPPVQPLLYGMLSWYMYIYIYTHMYILSLSLYICPALEGSCFTVTCR
jgi:hypothetical protein